MSKTKELYQEQVLETMTDFDYQYEQYLRDLQNQQEFESKTKTENE